MRHQGHLGQLGHFTLVVEGGEAFPHPLTTIIIIPVDGIWIKVLCQQGASHMTHTACDVMQPTKQWGTICDRIRLSRATAAASSQHEAERISQLINFVASQSPAASPVLPLPLAAHYCRGSNCTSTKPQSFPF